jgi:bla regulator protein blaR1
MNEVISIVQHLGPALANHLLQSTVFAAMIGLLTLPLRQNPARVRYWLWLAASLKFLVPFSLLIALGSLFPEHHYAALAESALSSALESVGQPFSSPPIVPSADLQGLPDRSAGYLPVALALVWLSGTVVVLLIWRVRWRQVSASLKQAVHVGSGQETEILRRVKPLVRVRSRVVMMGSAAMMAPGIFGIFRPVMLWPLQLTERLEDEHVESILMHELMHVRRRDNLTAAVHMLVEAVFWFHPMVWWIEKHMIEERERACDEAAVGYGMPAHIYAEGLLKACRFCIESPVVCVSGVTGSDLRRRVRSLMSSQRKELSSSKRLAICLLAFMAIMGPVTLGVMRRAPVYLQILQAEGPRPAFEVATIKPSQPNEETNMMCGTLDGYFTATHVSLRDLIRAAYQIRRDDQLTAAAAWTGREYFDIHARADASEIESMRKMPLSNRMDQFHLMLQSLLAERFRLAVSTTTRELPVYALVIASGGPKLKEVQVPPELASALSPPPPPPPLPPSSGSASALRAPTGSFPGIRQTAPNQLTFSAYRMSWLADWLMGDAEVGDRAVVDRTELKGSYDFALNGIAIPLFPGEPPPASDELSPSVFTALRQQLGLKLLPQKAPVEVLLVDHAEQPSPN